MDKKFILIAFLSLASAWFFQIYWGNKNQQASKGGPEVISKQNNEQVAPSVPTKIVNSQDFYRQLNTAVTFVENKNTNHDEIVSTVETPFYEAKFSNFGAILTGLVFKHQHSANRVNLLPIIEQKKVDVKGGQPGCFLLAFEKKTPFIYKLVQEQTTEKNNFKVTQLTYQSGLDGIIINKIFYLHHEKYQIDLELSLKSVSSKSTERLRLFMSSPFISGMIDDSINVVALNKGKNCIDKIDSSQAEEMAWPWNITYPIFGTEDKYFVHAVFSDPEYFIQRSFVVEDKSSRVNKKNFFSVLESKQISEDNNWNLSFYVGPKILSHLTLVDDRLGDLMAFGWLSWFCKILLQLLEFLFNFFKNYGIAIIFLGLILRLPLIPLSIYSRRKMEIYQRFQPTIQKIRLKYRHDTKLQHEEIMKFHAEHNLSTTTPMLGCLPMLIQLPILFALFRVLNNYISLYQAPFYFWITDLSSKDPYYVLPVLMGISMIWQQKMSQSSDGKQKVIMLFMSILFTAFFAKAPAGLVLYWLVNNVVTIGEDYLRKHIFK